MGDFKRTKTLCQGGDCCDFDFIRHDNDLFAAANTKLTDSEIKLLENEADKIKVKILGADMFRFAVKKKR